jgi:hypothetical protein
MSKEEIGEVVLEVLEHSFHVLLSREDSKDKKIYKKALANYKKVVENTNFYLKTLKEW